MLNMNQVKHFTQQSSLQMDHNFKMLGSFILKMSGSKWEWSIAMLGPELRVS